MRRTPMVIAVVLALAVPSIALARTTICNAPPGEGNRWVREPDHLEYATGPNLIAESKLRNLEWSDWGEKRAFATGRFILCRTSNDCRGTSASVVASRYSPDAIHGIPDHVYKKIKVIYGNQQRVFKLLLPTPGP
jgi:hypothetical protein